MIINLSARNNTEGKRSSCFVAENTVAELDLISISVQLCCTFLIECYYDVSDTIIILSKHRKLRSGDVLFRICRKSYIMHVLALFCFVLLRVKLLMLIFLNLFVAVFSRQWLTVIT